jgi:hypothetical protein
MDLIGPEGEHIFLRIWELVIWMLVFIDAATGGLSNSLDAVHGVFDSREILDLYGIVRHCRGVLAELV